MNNPLAQKLTVTQAALSLGVSRGRVIQLIHLGKIQAEKFGRDWAIDQASVEARKETIRK